MFATVTRIPRMHGCPDMTRGSTVIRLSISLFIIFQLCSLGGSNSSTVSRPPGSRCEPRDIADAGRKDCPVADDVVRIFYDFSIMSVQHPRILVPHLVGG